MAAIEPSQTPPAQVVPGGSGRLAQLPPTHASAVQALPSAHWAAVRQPTHALLATSQYGVAPPHWASLTQVTHIAEAEPSQTPPGQVVPAGSGALPQVPPVQASAVQALPSSQWPSVVQPTQVLLDASQ